MPQQQEQQQEAKRERPSLASILGPTHLGIALDLVRVAAFSHSGPSPAGLAVEVQQVSGQVSIGAAAPEDPRASTPSLGLLSPTKRPGRAPASTTRGEPGVPGGQPLASPHKRTATWDGAGAAVLPSAGPMLPAPTAARALTLAAPTRRSPVSSRGRPFRAMLAWAHCKRSSLSRMQMAALAAGRHWAAGGALAEGPQTTPARTRCWPCWTTRASRGRGRLGTWPYTRGPSAAAPSPALSRHSMRASRPQTSASRSAARAGRRGAGPLPSP